MGRLRRSIPSNSTPETKGQRTAPVFDSFKPSYRSGSIQWDVGRSKTTYLADAYQSPYHHHCLSLTLRASSQQLQIMPFSSPSTHSRRPYS